MRTHNHISTNTYAHICIVSILCTFASTFSILLFSLQKHQHSKVVYSTIHNLATSKKKNPKKIHIFNAKRMKKFATTEECVYIHTHNNLDEFFVISFIYTMYVVFVCFCIHFFYHVSFLFYFNTHFWAFKSSCARTFLFSFRFCFSLFLVLSQITSNLWETKCREKKNK